MPDDLLRDLEVLRDRWDGALGSRYYSKQLTALLAKHAKATAAPAAPKAEEWYCKKCGAVVADEDVSDANEDYEEIHHLDDRGTPCGPVERRKGGDG